MISFAVTAKLICVFVFAYAKIRFSYVAAQIQCNDNDQDAAAGGDDDDDDDDATAADDDGGGGVSVL